MKKLSLVFMLSILIIGCGNSLSNNFISMFQEGNILKIIDISNDKFLYLTIEKETIDILDPNDFNSIEMYYKFDHDNIKVSKENILLTISDNNRTILYNDQICESVKWVVKDIFTSEITISKKLALCKL